MHLKHRVLLGTYFVIASASGIFLSYSRNLNNNIFISMQRDSLAPSCAFFFFFFKTAHSGHRNAVNAHSEIERPNGHDLAAFHGKKVNGR